MPSLLYIGQNPGAGTGSPVIVLRHLRRFAAAGWTISILADYGGDYAACRAAGWTVTTLCHRRWWWPPYRQDSARLRWIRLRLLARDAAARFTRPDVILSYLAYHSDFSAELATHVAQVTGAPLHMLVHDDATAFPTAAGREAEIHAAHEAILRDADTCWFVSPELAARFPSVGSRSRQLFPIPEGWTKPAAWREELQRTTRVYYAGHVWPEQMPLLARASQQARASGAELAIVAKPTPELRAFCDQHRIHWQPPFGTNPEVLEHLVRHAAGVIVSYADTVAAMPWCATSFPSKLVEYAHLGLPIGIFAPPESSVGRWARRTGFAGFFAPNDVAAMERWFTELRSRRTWEMQAAASLQLARREFDPEQIQAELANTLRPGTERRAA